MCQTRDRAASGASGQVAQVFGTYKRLSFEVKYGAQCDVDLHEFVPVQAACEVAEALRVDGGGLLDQYPDVLAEKLDGGVDLPGRVSTGQVLLACGFLHVDTVLLLRLSVFSS
jgi:hypothetical protein